MSSLRYQKLKDLKFMEEELENPTFNWQGNTYTFIPSISLFNRELGTGGFKLVKLLSATVRLYTVIENEVTGEEELNQVFSNGGTPAPQQIITYGLDGTNFRIESVKFDPTNSYFRIMAHSTVKGL